jgi:predicted nucleic acid-binding protein
MVIIDTTVWIDYLRGNANPETMWLDRELSNQPLGITDIILCEVLQGILDDRSAARVERDLLRLNVFETGGAELAIAAAANYRALRRKGHTVRMTIDCLIATFCIRAGHSLLHRDRDFALFERELHLPVLHP